MKQVILVDDGNRKHGVTADTVILLGVVKGGVDQTQVNSLGTSAYFTVVDSIENVVAALNA